MAAPACPSLQDLVDRAYRRCKDLIQSNISVLHRCADLLMEREQIDGEDLQALLVEAQSEQVGGAGASGLSRLRVGVWVER